MKKLLLSAFLVLAFFGVDAQILTNMWNMIGITYANPVYSVSLPKGSLKIQRQNNVVYIGINDDYATKLYYAQITSPVMVSSVALEDTLISWVNEFTGGGGGINGWSLIGNSGTNPPTNFIGTTDLSSLNFRANSTPSGRIDANGNTFYGLNAGALYTQDTGHVINVVVDNGGTDYENRPPTVIIENPTNGGLVAVAHAIVSQKANKIQHILALCDAGTFTLTFGSITTGSLNWNASIASLQSEINSAWGLGVMIVTGTSLNTGFDIEFIGALCCSPQADITSSTSLTLAGKSAPIYITESQAGNVGGVITGFTIITGGEGYNVVPRVTILGGNDDAVAHCEMNIPMGTNNIAIGNGALMHLGSLNGRGAITNYPQADLGRDTTNALMYWYQDPTNTSNNRIYLNGEFSAAIDPVYSNMFLNKLNGYKVGWGNGVDLYESLVLNSSYYQSTWLSAATSSYFTIDDLGFTFEATPTGGSTAQFKMDLLGGLTATLFLGALTDGAPTTAEIEVVLGLGSTHSAGYFTTIQDSDGTGLLYKVQWDGTNWSYWVGTHAN